jgi:hypothetical protein
MSIPQNPQPAKLIIGAFMADKAVFGEVAAALSRLWGPIDVVSLWFPFDKTAYYAAEMGGPLFRRILTFSQLISQGALAEIKIATNALESRLAEEGRRRVNIDPGYLVAERFVLATGKNYVHRIYLGSGIYADLTLVYERGGYRALKWTYPDYGSEDIIRFLESVRNRYLFQLSRERER